MSGYLFLIRKRYKEQQAHSKERGIDFKFTFEEWVNWWKSNLGSDWFRMRGRRRDQYCMARIGDTGPYSLENVKCLLSSSNVGEQFKNGTAAHPSKRSCKGTKNGRAKLTEDQVLEIFYINEPRRRIAKKFGVSPQTVKAIKDKTGWIHLTQNLPG